MSKFRFSVTSLQNRQEGVVESANFSDAVTALGKHVTVHKGDVLEIGVFGFPPARFECVGQITEGEPVWFPAGQMAA